MSKKALLLTFAICAVLALISIFTVDRLIALGVHNSGFERAAAVVRGREFLDIFTGRGVALLGNNVALGQFMLSALLIVLREGRRGQYLRRFSICSRVNGWTGAGTISVVIICFIVGIRRELNGCGRALGP